MQAISFRGVDTGSVVTLPDVKGKNIIGPLPKNLPRCEVKILLIPMKQKQNIVVFNQMR